MAVNNQQGIILVVDDNKGILAAVEILLQTLFAKIITTTNPNRIRQILEDEQVDVVLLDMNFSAGINSGNLSLVASELGISRQTLYNKIKRYEL